MKKDNEQRKISKLVKEVISKVTVPMKKKGCNVITVQSPSTLSQMNLDDEVIYIVGKGYFVDCKTYGIIVEDFDVYLHYREFYL